MRAKWNDWEHQALRGLSLLAQLLYLRVFRWRMNYRTGISGGPGNRITQRTLIEEVGFVPDPRSTKKAWAPTRGEVRAALAELERPRVLDPDSEPVILLLDAGSSLENGLVKKLPLADVDGSAQNMNNQRATNERPMNDPMSDPMNRPMGYAQQTEKESVSQASGLPAITNKPCSRGITSTSECNKPALRSDNAWSSITTSFSYWSIKMRTGQPTRPKRVTRNCKLHFPISALVIGPDTPSFRTASSLIVLPCSQ